MSSLSEAPPDPSDETAVAAADQAVGEGLSSDAETPHESSPAKRASTSDTTAAAPAAAAASSSSSGPNRKAAAPFRMKIKAKLRRGGARKRKLGQASLSSSSSSSSSSSDEEEEDETKKPDLQQPDGWRVKLYRLNADGSWDDCGTGRIVCLYRPPSTAKNTDGPPPQQSMDQWLYQETGEATLCVHAEVTKQHRQPRVLLRTRILLRDAYQRQGDNIITWCEPYYGRGGENNSNSGNQSSGVDLALSFQDNAGCLDIWRQITHVQGRAAELLRQHQQQLNHANGKSTSVEDMAARVAAQHHADLQRQQQHDLWNSALSGEDLIRNGDDSYASSIMEMTQSLPNPPTLQNLAEIADTIAVIHNVQQRENLALWIAKDECAYLRALLALFPAAEERDDNEKYEKLAMLAACVKTILLLNDPSILELIVNVESIFEEVCSCLEYDPDLREKANHRWFLRERAKFRTVVPMEDPELVSAIHRSFRVQYLRDTLLRPTMDESSLSTLTSLQMFTHADVVKGVTMAGTEPEGSLYHSYLVKIIDTLCIELHYLVNAEWNQLETHAVGTEHAYEDLRTDPSIVVGKHGLGTTTWKQYLAPQDTSPASRRMRRRGCLSFLKELFNMVRCSLQQSDKEDFFSVICTLDIDLSDASREIADNVSQTSQMVEVGSVASTVKSDPVEGHVDGTHPALDAAHPPPATNLLSMLACVIADPTTDVSEKGSALEIISGVVMHDPGLIRRHCLENHAQRKKKLEDKKSNAKPVSSRPEPNEKKQVIFFCLPNDLLSSLLFLLDVETDAGVLLQVSEIMRIVLDTDMVSDYGPMSAGITDDAEGIPPAPGGQLQHEHHHPSGFGASSAEQKQFLSLFYDHYVEWLVAPFQFTLLHPIRRVPDHIMMNASESPLLQRMISNFQHGVPPSDPFLKAVPTCAVRCSFAVELLSFCVRAHLYRMKFFLLRSRVLGNVLKLLRPHPYGRGISGDRCLKLAALRFLRAILSVNDEYYHRHIIQHDLFAPVFEALRANPVGDNLVSSAIVEMCDYIHIENIKSLIEYIVTKHLSANRPENQVQSLEDVSGPYVSTLTVLRKAYESNLNANKKPDGAAEGSGSMAGPISPGGSRYFTDVTAHHPARHLSGKALEDQRKFREADQEESYFDSDDDDEVDRPPRHATAVRTAVDEVDAQQVESELHRTPRMFSLAQVPLLSHLDTGARSNGAEDAAEKPLPMELDDERRSDEVAAD